MPKPATKLRDVPREEKDAFVRKNWGLILSLTRRNRSQFTMIDEDLIQAGAINMARSLDYWDETKGRTRESYAASWVLAAAQQELLRYMTRGLGGLWSALKEGKRVDVHNMGGFEDKHSNPCESTAFVVDPDSVEDRTIDKDWFWGLAEKVIRDSPQMTPGQEQKSLFVLTEVLRNGRTCREVAGELGLTFQEIGRVRKRLIRLLRSDKSFLEQVEEFA